MSWLFGDWSLWIGYIAFLLSCLFVVIMIHRKSFRADEFGEIYDYIVDLLNSGVDRAYLSLYFDKVSTSILFRKYILRDGRYGLEALTPKIDSASEPLSRFKTFCEENAMSLVFRTEPNGIFKAGDVMEDGDVEVVCVDCGRDVDIAYGLVKFLTLESEQMTEHDSYEYERGGGFRHGELVNDPEKVAFTEQEEAEYQVKQIETGAGLKPLELAAGGFLYTLQIFAYIGLLYSLLVEILVRALSIPVEWGVWSANVLDLNLSGKILDIVFIFLVLIGPLMVFTQGYWKFWRSSLFDEKGAARDADAQSRAPDRQKIIHEVTSKIKDKRNILLVLVALSWI